MKRILTLIYLPTAALYLFLSFIYPTDPVTIAKRHISIGEARMIAFTFALSLIIVWLFAFYGSWRLKQYSYSIRNYRDGAAFLKLAEGMQVLAIYLPIRSVSKILLNYLAHLHPSFTAASNLIITYINVLLPLLAYILIGYAARSLLFLAKAKISITAMYALILAFSLIGVTYCYVIFSTLNKLTPTDWLVTTQYNMSAALKITTIIVPYVFMWCVGLIAAFEIFLYQKLIKGVFYRKSLKLLAWGLTLEIFASVIIQYITAIAADLRRLPTIVILVLMYSVLIVVAAAFAIIARGVSKLKVLEEA